MHRTSKGESIRLTKDMRSSSIVEAAKAYIQAGLKVVVTHGIKADGTCTCGKRQCSKPGKHPIAEFFPRGANSATDNVALVRKCISRVPRANIAIALNDLTVIDIDGPDGKQTVREADLPKTIGVRTGRGVHRYFHDVAPCGSFKAEQIDILTGEGHYVMAPPSRHVSGVHYRWLFSVAKQTAGVPSDILQLRKSPVRMAKASRRTMIPKGARNEEIFRTACSLRRRFRDDETIFEMMRVVNQRLCEEPLADDELRKAVTSSSRYHADEGELFGAPKETNPQPMDWLWYPYIPRYGVTILAGDPGRGKSLLSSLLIATVTSGKAWPLTQSQETGGGRVLLLSAEDNWSRVTLRRLLRAGANIDNIHVMHKFRALTDDRMEQLAAEMESWRPDLVVVDTLSAYMGGGRDMHRQNEVGEFLALLTEMAEATGAAVLGLGHLNKQQDKEPLYRIVGSIGFAATIRSAIFLGSNPADASQLALAHGKANASDLGRTILFAKEGGGKDEVPILKPMGFSDAGASDVCRIEQRSPGRPRLEREEAEEFVLEFLENNSLAEWDRIRRAAEARGIASEGTLNLVRAELARDKKIVQVGKARHAKWKRTMVKPDANK
jgi:hypothetical protein